MNTLIKKQYTTYDYASRYSGVPYYYDKRHDRMCAGIYRAIDKTTSYGSHTVAASDSLDSISLKYYNNPTYWWAIAQFNDILDPFIELSKKYKTLKVPNISSITFK